MAKHYFRFVEPMYGIKLDSEVKLVPSIQSFKTKLKALNGEDLRKAGLLRKTGLALFLFYFFIIFIILDFFAGTIGKQLQRNFFLLTELYPKSKYFQN